MMTRRTPSTPTPGGSTIVETLVRRAETERDARCFTFLDDDGAAEAHLTYGELLARARAIAGRLRSLDAAGERALLLYPPGLDYAAAIYGCLCAGTVAVPAYPPRPDRPPARVERIAADAAPRVVLTTSALRSSLEGRLEETPALARIAWVATDALGGDEGSEWSPPSVERDTLALLQYTSGSTHQPKGVMVSHGNLQHNLGLICAGFQMSEADQGLLWLPSYHDMGLVGGILVPPYAGFPVALMSPAAFVQRPLRWLQAIARYGATISGGPNFAYELCVERTTPEERRALDLRGWRVAFCGAEPVRASTLKRFADAFAAAGFRRASFYPCYGMAETTLIATGGRGPAAPVLHTVRRDDLERNRAAPEAEGEPRTQTLVGCGGAMPDLTVRIVDPETCAASGPDRVGEIWVSGPSVAQGYWNHPDETGRSFRARLAGDEDHTFLRTGDLGFLDGGELFVTGRLKDLILIDGRNYHPQDVEATVEPSHAALQPHGGAAFSIEVDGAERLVVVQELKRSALRSLDADEVVSAIRDAVARNHDLPVHAVALVRPLAIPRTSSGKIRRHACRDAFLSGALPTVAAWPPAGAGAPPLPSPPPRAEAGEIQAWLVARVSALSGVAPRDLDVHRPVAYYGLSSVQAVSLTGELEQWLGRRVPATLPYDYPTIAALADRLARGADAPSATALSPAAAASEPVAIVGMACRLPGAPDLEAFWRLLESGGDAIGEVPADRRVWWERYAEGARRAGDPFPRHGGFLGPADSFDPHFFGITPREAASIDPQQRLLLELAWEALEDAGQPLEPLRGARAGVFVGISSSDYSRLRADDPERTDPYAGTGNALSIAANRLSYALDLHGPSLAVDTACSSSLVAVHLAAQSLRAGQCGLALAGGVNLLLSPAVTATFAKAGFLSPDGRCKAFDARADGYVRGEGAGIVVLRPLSRALADGDRIYAVIRGSAVNSGGRANGLTAPSRLAQEAVLRDAYADARVAPGDVQYVEAHGTGTALGDPIEAEALGNVLGEGRAPGERCAIGSVKTNIGHLEAAAGIAGLIKTALALSRGTIPPSLHFREANPHIPFARLPLEVQRNATPWPAAAGPARAGVSSFGFGGTNAHVVLERAPRAAGVEERPARDAQAWVLPLSAARPEALRAQAGRLRERLASGAEDAWPDVCYTASVRRTHHEHRLALVARAPEEAAELLGQFLRGEPPARLVSGRAARPGPPTLVFVFPGQGPQWWAMGRELLEHDPVFQAALDECDRALPPEAGWSVREALAADEDATRLDQTRFAQPALVALQIALAARWRHWGIVPDAVVGHSLGEVTAAHVSGVLSLEDTMRIAYHRGRVMQKATGLGRMGAAELPVAEVQAVIAAYGPALAIAAVNGPRQTVVSGEPAAVGDVLRCLRARGVRCHELPVDYAFHSAQMAALTSELAQALHGLQPRPAAVPVVPSADGANGDGFGVSYWPRQIERPVRFADAIGRLLDDGHRLFLEIGPHPVLSGSIAECLRERGLEGRVLPSLRRGAEDRTTLLTSLGSLYAEGYPVDWRHLYPAGGRLVSLPSYPWQRERCWIDGEPPALASAPRRGHRDPAAHPLLGERVELAAFAGTYVWENELDPGRHRFLHDHVFQGMALVPGTAYFELALAAAMDAFGRRPPMLRRIEFRSPLFLPPEASRTLQVVLEPEAEGRRAFRIFSRPGGANTSASAWTLHAVGEVDGEAPAAAPDPMSEETLREIRARCSETLTGEAHFAELRQRSFDYGPAFQGLTELWRRPGEALGRLRVPDVLQAELPSYHLHPALLDAGAQLLVSADAGRGRPFLPRGIEAVKVYADRGQPCWGHAVIRSDALPDAQGFVGDIRLADADGNVVVEALGLRVQYMDGDSREALAPPADRWLYVLDWEARPRADLPAADARGTWLILGDGGGVGDGVAARLREAGGRCFVVRAEAGDDAAAPRRALEAATPTDAPLRGVVHLWSLDAAPAESADAVAVAAAASRGPATAAGLVQALGTDDHRDTRLWLVTRGAHALGDDAHPAQAPQAPLWGLGRTILQEQPSLAGGLLDLDPEASADESAAALVVELLQPDGETQIAFRAGARHVARLARWRPSAAPEVVRLRADASYLITGGLGGLGLSVAHWMIEQGARRLILMGRSALPPRAEWAAVGSDSRLAGQVAAIRRLEAEGASVHLASVDVSDEGQLTAFLDTFRREGWPEIRGVAHAAGVVQDEIVPRLDLATLDAVFRAKVAGGWLLHRAFTGPRLDFFVLFSSAAALLGSPGQGSYAAANAFLDALAHRRRAQGQAALSINWGPWAEIGMAARGTGRLAAQGIGSLKPEEALDVFGQLLGERAAQVGVIPIHWDRLAQSLPALRTAPLLARLADERAFLEESAEGPAAARPREALLAAEPADRPRLVEDFVREQVARVAGLAPASIDGQQPLNALGIDSLMSIDLKSRLERALGVVVPVIRLLEVPTLAGLAGVLAEELERSVKPAAGDPVASDRREQRAAPGGTPMVAISPGGPKPPFFCVHPGALDVQVYVDLAQQLDDDRPFHALQPHELDGYPGRDREAVEASIESIARSCVAALTAVQPHGPYHLGGWSLGGVVGFEIAQQLRARGEPVALLAMFDSPSPATGERPDDHGDDEMVRMFAGYVGARRGLHLTVPADAGGERTLSDRLGRLLELAEAARALPPGTGLDQIRSLFEAYKDGLRVGTRLLWRYRPQAYAGPISYFRAVEEVSVLERVFPRATTRWAALAPAVVVHDVPGSHYTMFMEPHVGELARRLRECIRAAAQAAAPAVPPPRAGKEASA